MKILQTIYLLVGVLLIQGCNPLELDKLDDEPVFTLDMIIDGKSYVFEAGNEGFFMQTEVVSLGPTIYSGTLLRKIDGQLIDNELVLKIGFQISEDVNNQIRADHYGSFKTGQVPYSTVDNDALPIKEVVFFSSYIGTGTEVLYTWDYGDGSSVVFQSPIHAYPTTENYSANVIALDNNQCFASANNTVSFDNRKDCVASIAVTNVSTSGAILEASSGAIGPYQYLWSDGTTANDVAVNITNSSDVQTHCVTITDSEGCSSISCIGIIKDAAGTVNTCSVQMTETNYAKARQAKQFNSVELEWFDEMKEEFSSRDVLQGSDSSFEIISFEEYTENAQGERTVKIEFEFSCTLYQTGGTDPIRVENAKGTMAVAIP